MCGIAGIFNYSNTQPEITQELLTRMSDIIRHRGPDDDGTYISKDRTVGFAFRRLAIIDLSPAGHQPMSNADGSVWIVFNGEIYNHLKLRAELEHAGYRYKSRSDTETLIYAYEHWGERFVDRLEGMFAIAIHDEKKQKLLLYRDRIGIKPLYYIQANGQLIFGSEIKALFEHPAVEKRIDERSMYHYLTYIHTPAPLTLFQNIRKLEAGHYLSIDRTGKLQDQEYWDAIIPHTDARYEADAYRDEKTITENILRLLEAAIEKRMMSDVPFGVFLSGGIDSSANVALMSRLMQRPVETFSVAIKGQEDTNEFQWARKISTLFKTNHHEIVIGDDGFLDLVPTIVFHQDEPLADPVCFPLYHVSKLARDNGVIVVQVGEGSDEQFCGYKNYLLNASLMKKNRWMQAIPAPFKRFAYRCAVPYLKSRRMDYRQNIVKNMMYGDPVFWGNAIAFYEKEKNNLLSERMKRAMHAEHSYSFYEKRNAKLLREKDAGNVEQIIYWELKNRLAELLLMRVDKITMATSIEARVPFLDHALVEYSMNIPSAFKTKHDVTKYILKQALRGILPDEIIDRKKIGFAGSGKNMMTKEIYAHAKHLLLHSSHGYFEKEYLRTFLAEYERHGYNYTPQLWTLYNFELWWKWWIEGDKNLSR